MDPYLTLERMQEILAAVRGLRVGVVGDAALEGRWYTEDTPAEFARERPFFAQPVVAERYASGGAANVARNLSRLGLAETRLFSVLGADWRGDVLLQTLRADGVDTGGVLVEPGWSTPFYARILQAVEEPVRRAAPLPAERARETARLDFANLAELSVQGELSLLSALEAALPALDALVVVDFQSPGVITPRILEGLNRLAATPGRATFSVDSRERIGAFLNMVRNPNEAEAARWLFPDRAPGTVRMEEFAEVALYPQVDCGCPLVITLGEQGCLAIDSGESHLVPAVPVPPPVDRAGAGDTFLAALTAGLAAGAGAVEAARLGHYAAAVTVRKLGRKGSATAEEILALGAALARPTAQD